MNASAQTMAAAAITARQNDIIRLFNGQIYLSNALDVGTGKLWDRVRFKKGDRFGASFFASPKGKGWADTNVYRPCLLDAPEAFAVQRILFVFSASASPNDIFGVAESVGFRFWLGQKTAASAPLISLPTSKASVAPIRICTYCHAVYCQDRNCPGCGAREFRLSGMEEETGTQFFFEPLHSIVIANQMSFLVDFEGDPWEIQSDFSLWCYFEGLHARGCQ